MYGALSSDEQATKETLDEEGWVHTGDVGLMDEVRMGAVISFSLLTPSSVILVRKAQDHRPSQGKHSPSLHG